MVTCLFLFVFVFVFVLMSVWDWERRLLDDGLGFFESDEDG